MMTDTRVEPAPEAGHSGPADPVAPRTSDDSTDSAAPAGAKAALANTSRALTPRPPRRSAANRNATIVRWILKPLVWAGALTPLAILGVRALNDDLTANPIELLTNWTGFTTLTLLMVTLAITPLRRLTGWNPLIKLRRPIGLFAFFYATLHFLVYLVLDQFFWWEGILGDIMDRPYITVGFAGFLLLIPLAFTSTRGWIRRLGKRWQMLHRAVYLVGGLGVLHFYWKVKADTRQPLIFAAILATLLLARLIPSFLARRPRSSAR
ncbi:MAG: protein-methionine-sulfoxide reductase heme-binding subunit MsrQ [Gemmatimonadota bacterium]|jgi:sulfoxide reductase heme-binding subunit YedZ